ncbi:uncharacterized protein IL334_004208 [Kwoniella shivajii]|uniref:Uncharacterized protein n=1 Tax=Kwoniella shivajii TaxID=564305 RepID=A0ABZ1CZQ1_9TREE|nr:hypothetical protein IL334_004208 [Kwoniella shivajii]
MLAQVFAILTFALCTLGFSISTQRDVKVLAGAPINSLNLTVVPDSPIEDSNITLYWGSGDAGTAPYILQIGTGGYYANLTWLYEYTNLTETNLTWNVNVTAGETLVFQLTDGTNTTTYSQNHLIQSANGTDLDDSTSSAVAQDQATVEDEDEDESFLGELLADIQAELDG